MIFIYSLFQCLVPPLAVSSTCARQGEGGCSLGSHQLPGLLSVFISDKKETKKTVSPG